MTGAVVDVDGPLTGEELHERCGFRPTAAGLMALDEPPGPVGPLG